MNFKIILKGEIMKKLLSLIVVVLFLGSLFAVESDPSEVVGYVEYSCVFDAVAGDYNLIAIPMNAGYTLASELGSDYPSITSIRHWDNVAQSWVASDNLGGGFWWPDNAIVENEVYYINVDANTDIYIAGGMNADPSYSLVSDPVLGDYNAIMLPLDSAFTLASELGNDIGVCTSIREWDNVAQSWVASDNLGGGFWWPDNPVAIAGAYYINVSANTTWPTVLRSASTVVPAEIKNLNMTNKKVRK